jgi:hypothetical protein
MGLVIFAGMLITAIVAGVVGFVVGARVTTIRRLRELGFSKASADLYDRAANILNRLVRITKLDGDFAADILSDQSREQIEKWLSDYRKQVNKV